MSCHSLGTTVFSYSCVSSLYVLFSVFKMFEIIELPALCEVHSMINFLSARNLSPTHIHWQICEVYCQVLPCVKAKCISEAGIFKLTMTLLVGKFWATLRDFHLFCYLKYHIGGNHYKTNEVMKTAMTSWLSTARKFLWRW